MIVAQTEIGTDASGAQIMIQLRRDKRAGHPATWEVVCASRGVVFWRVSRNTESAAREKYAAALAVRGL